MKVAVLGASSKPERYSCKAIQALEAEGHDIVPIRPGSDTVHGYKAVADLKDLEPGSVNTVTVYVGPDRSGSLVDSFLHLKPERVIFNPGAENHLLAQTLREAGIEVVEGCTLVMLSTGTF